MLHESADTHWHITSQHITSASALSSIFTARVWHSTPKIKELLDNKSDNFMQVLVERVTSTN